VRYTLVLGDDEIKNGNVQMRDMQTSEQKTITQEQLLGLLK
jgi:histidyl-tRNA synthetase